MKLSARIFPLTAALLLAACGDEVTQINQTGLEVYSAEKDLPKCTDDNEGEMALVKGETSVRVCIDGGWFSTAVGEASNAEFACSTEELADGSGLKIICNGDSIGVVYNGAQGEAGKDGKDGDDGKDGEDGKDAVLPNDSLENDPEREAISLDSLAGYSQKGPFLKGATVYLYELSDGRTLKQTNGNFTSYITRNDGRYKFLARDLVSQYAMIVVEGNYRNEVTGKSSNATIRLRAITDMRKHSDANINLLTHLEFDRVYHLVTRGDKDGKKLTVKQAKKQAQKEILKLFHIELDENADAEDMNVFGESDADAALLAISVLLQGDRNETELMVLLTEITAALEEKGEWSGAYADSVKASIADWAMMADISNRLDTIRANVLGWGLNDKVPAFEKMIRNYWLQERKAGECNAAREGELFEVPYKNIESLVVKCTQGSWNLRSLKDNRDGHEYLVVKIGDQTWMAENLNFFDDQNESMHDTTLCYENSTDNCEIYGRYYTWGVAMDGAAVYSNNAVGCGYESACLPEESVRGICPDGWHLPSLNELISLNDAMLLSGYASPVWPFFKEDGIFTRIRVGYYDWRQSYYDDEIGDYVYEYGMVNFKHTGVIWGTAGSESTRARVWIWQPSSSLGIDSWVYDKMLMPVRCIKDE